VAPTAPSGSGPNAPAGILPATVRICWPLVRRLSLAAEPKPGLGVTFSQSLQTPGAQEAYRFVVTTDTQTAMGVLPLLSSLREGSQEAPHDGRRTRAFVHLFPQGCWSIRAATASLSADLYFVYWRHGGGNRQTQEPFRLLGPDSPATRQPSLRPLRPIVDFISALTGAAPFSPPRGQEYVWPGLSSGGKRTTRVAGGHHYTRRTIGDFLSGWCVSQETMQKAIESCARTRRDCRLRIRRQSR